MKSVALAGNPNSGKTTLFNSLTGSTAHVGNWPGVTVDKREGLYKKCEEQISIVDLPGIYSLSPYTPEEVISRNYILDEKPDCVINIIDSTNLERNLYLTTQLMEIDIPVVIALNMVDVLEKNGDVIDAQALEKKLGIPVVAISALRNNGLEELMNKVYEASKSTRKGTTVLAKSALGHLIGDCRIALEGQGVTNPLFHAIKLVEQDELEVKEHTNSVKMVEDFKATFKDDTFGTDFEALIADSRYKYISDNYAKVIKKQKKNGETITKSDKIDRVLTHRIWGIPIFLVILFLVFHFTFAEDFLFLGAGGVFDKDIYAYDANGSVIEVTQDTFDEGQTYYTEDGYKAELSFAEDGSLDSIAAKAYVYSEKHELVYLEDLTEIPEGVYYADKGCKWKVEITKEDGELSAGFVSEIDEFCSEITVNTFFGYEESVLSLGVVLQTTLCTFTDLLSVCVHQGLVSATTPEWLTGLLVDGILGGVFSVLSFLPQILLLFLFFSILEDSGYMARVAFILDKIFRKFGLSGRAFMPMIMGFGCSVPAMINTRTLADRNERTATVRVIPFFSCGAKLPILTAVAGGIVSRFGIGNADLITYAMYLLGIVVAIASVILMRNTTMKGEVPPFIMELPTYHAPQFKNLMAHLWDKTKHFVKKAFTIILASTILIWSISHFSFAWGYLDDSQMNDSILAGLGKLVQPLFTPLGFGSQLGSWGWVFVVAAITGLIAKENVIATFGTLATCIVSGFEANEALEGVDSVVQMISATGITIPALIAFIAFNMLTIPCFAAVATAKSELPDKKSYIMTLIFWIGTSYIVSMAIYIIGSSWWTSFIFAVILALAITVIVLENKGKINLKNIFKSNKDKKKKKSVGCCGSCSGCPGCLSASVYPEAKEEDENKEE